MSDSQAVMGLRVTGSSLGPGGARDGRGFRAWPAGDGGWAHFRRVDGATGPRIAYVHPMARKGRIGREEAVLRRDDADRLLLDWRGERIDLSASVVRHEDHHGRVTFSITRPDGSVMQARYRRRGPVPVLYAIENPGAVLELSEDLWTWEDRDFGLFVYAVVTGTGPAKHRDMVLPERDWGLDPAPWRVVGDMIHAAPGPGLGRHAVALAELRSVRVKFVLDSVWADPIVLVLEGGHDVVTVPITCDERPAPGSHDLTWLRRELLPQLQALPGWTAKHDRRLERALRYRRTRQRWAPFTILGLNLHWFAERGIWATRVRGGAHVGEDLSQSAQTR